MKTKAMGPSSGPILLCVLLPFAGRCAVAQGSSGSELPHESDVSVLIVPLLSEDWHGGYDLEIGVRGGPDDVQLDSAMDSTFATEVRERIAALDTREWHEDYNLSKGTRAHASFGVPEPVTDPALTLRLLEGLALLDKSGFPDEPDSQSVEMLRQSFPNFPERTQPWYCDLFYRDLDGVPPRDMIAFVHSGGSAGCYALHVAVRSPDKAIYQVLDGCWRGQRNMLYRAGERDSVFWFTSGYADSTVVVDGVPRSYSYVNNNLWWPNSGGIMTEMCDLLVPYFWDGEKLAWDDKAAKVFYAKLSKALKYLAPVDSTVIASAIATMF